MAEVKILVKFFSSNPAENIISALAVKPELLLPIGYGTFLSDQERMRLNFFFHRRGQNTIVMEPLVLKRYREPDIKAKLLDLFLKIGNRSIVLDVSGADHLFGMAIGEILSEHEEWDFPVLDLRMDDGIFIPQKHVRPLRGLHFPRLSGNEIRFLNRVAEQESDVIKRKDLNHSFIRAIQATSKLMNSRPGYWRAVSEQFRLSFPGEEAKELEILADSDRVSVPREALESLVGWKLLTDFQYKNHVVQIRFESQEVKMLMYHMEELDTFRSFLLVAGIRNMENNKAVFHELQLVERRYITCIYIATPYVMMVIDSATKAIDIYHFYEESNRMFGKHARKILISSKMNPPTEEIDSAVNYLRPEIIPIEKLAQKLEPRY